MSSLYPLAQLISSGVQKIESACAAQGQPYPSLEDPYTAENGKVQSQYVAEAAPIIAAAYQLIATLTHPVPYLFNWGIATNVSTALCAVNESYVPDILREAGPNGLHVNDIAVKNGMDPKKLERIMRFLATRHLFNEVSPAVFSNNRMSWAMCTNKTVEELQTKPLDLFDGTNGVSAMTQCLGGECTKYSAYLPEFLIGPETAHSYEPNKAPHNIVDKTDLVFHTWLQRSENTRALKRIQYAMQAFVGYASEDLPSGGFDWASLPANSLVVDVGGGIGTISMHLASRFGHLRFMVQDLAGAISEGRQHWSLNMPSKLESGCVELREHDFFEEQPARDAKVFMLRYILHNWPDQYCAKILKRLRDAAQPDTKLVIWDEIIEYMSRDSSNIRTDIPGAAKAMAPAPLLPHPEEIAGIAYGLDLVMLACLNAQERTLDHFIELLHGSGWKVERVHRIPAPHPQQLVCSPI